MSIVPRCEMNLILTRIVVGIMKANGQRLIGDYEVVQMEPGDILEVVSEDEADDTLENPRPNPDLGRPDDSDADPDNYLPGAITLP